MIGKGGIWGIKSVDSQSDGGHFSGPDPAGVRVTIMPVLKLTIKITVRSNVFGQFRLRAHETDTRRQAGTLRRESMLLDRRNLE